MTKPVINLFPHPHSNQKKIIQAINDPAYKYIIVACGRQFGKSKLLKAVGVKYCITEKNIIVLYATPKVSQAEKVYTEIVNEFAGKNLIKSANKSRGQAVIEFNNGSQMLFRSSGQGNALRGITTHYVILDETAFINEEVIKEVILPMMLVAGKKMIVASTPFGKNLFYKWYNQGISKDKDYEKWCSFKFTSYDNPYAQADELRNLKLELSEAEFRQEVLCEFVSSAGIFSNIDELSDLTPLEKPEKDKVYYCGVDIGMVNDATVFSIVDNDGNLVNYYRYKRITADKIKKHLVELNTIWKFERILVEINNQGRPIFEDLMMELNNVIDFTTTSVTKNIIINDLIYLFNTKSIHLCKSKDKTEMQDELSGFIFKQTGTGYTKYEAASGIGDDCVISLALAIHCKNKYGYKGYYNVVYGL